jgi:GDP-4-dehydro-6-deoxy-D-mannose reductase
MKALVTGAGGFVGPYLVKYLVSKGFEVFGFDRKGSKIEGCQVEPCDITDYNAVSKLIQKIKPDHVFHLAGQSSVALSFKEPEMTRKVNAYGTRNLLEAIVAAKIKPKILIVSSAQVYGIPKKVPITEQHPIAPVSPYGESKVEQEELSLQYAKENGLSMVICRSFNHTGPGQPSEFICSQIAKQVADLEKGKITVIKVGNVNAKRDFTDVRDIVQAYLLALEQAEPGEIYNICSGKAYSIQEVIDTLLELANVEAEIEKDTSQLRPSDIPILLGDNSKFISATNWQLTISLKRMLSDMLDYWRKNG